MASAFGGHVSLHSPSEASIRDHRAEAYGEHASASVTWSHLMGLGRTLEHWRKADTRQSGARFP